MHLANGISQGCQLPAAHKQVIVIWQDAPGMDSICDSFGGLKQLLLKDTHPFAGESNVRCMFITRGGNVIGGLARISVRRRMPWTTVHFALTQYLYALLSGQAAPVIHKSSDEKANLWPEGHTTYGFAAPFVVMHDSLWPEAHTTYGFAA